MIIYNNTLHVENLLKLESSDDIYSNVEEDTLTEASKIFIYLNFCPTPEMMSMIRKCCRVLSFQQKMENCVFLGICIIIKKLICVIMSSLIKYKASCYCVKLQSSTCCLLISNFLHLILIGFCLCIF